MSFFLSESVTLFSVPKAMFSFSSTFNSFSTFFAALLRKFKATKHPRKIQKVSRKKNCGLNLGLLTSLTCNFIMWSSLVSFSVESKCFCTRNWIWWLLHDLGRHNPMCRRFSCWMPISTAKLTYNSLTTKRNGFDNYLAMVNYGLRKSFWTRRQTAQFRCTNSVLRISLILLRAQQRFSCLHSNTCRVNQAKNYFQEENRKLVWPKRLQL